MIKLCRNLVLFLLLFVGVAILVVLLPATPRWNDSLHYVQPDKDSLMANTPGPRLVLLGGSNVGMSFDSQMLKDSLGVNPINGGLHGGFGLKFMLDNAAQYLRKGDVVVVMPEYEQYESNVFYGGKDLVDLLVDVSSEKISLVNFRQAKHVLNFIPSYIKIKLLPSSYLYRRSSRPDAYLRSAYNDYGDAVAHWTDRESRTLVVEELKGMPEESVVVCVREWMCIQSERGIRVYLSYPVCEKESYRELAGYIKALDCLLLSKGVSLLGRSGDFVMDASLFYDTNYHTTELGARKRTAKLISLLRAEIDYFGKE